MDKEFRDSVMEICIKVDMKTVSLQAMGSIIGLMDATLREIL